MEGLFQRGAIPDRFVHSKNNITKSVLNRLEFWDGRLKILGCLNSKTYVLKFKDSHKNSQYKVWMQTRKNKI